MRNLLWFEGGGGNALHSMVEGGSSTRTRRISSHLPQRTLSVLNTGTIVTNKRSKVQNNTKRSLQPTCQRSSSPQERLHKPIPSACNQSTPNSSASSPPLEGSARGAHSTLATSSRPPSNKSASIMWAPLVFITIWAPPRTETGDAFNPPSANS
jgi:hypothetical protein